MAEEGGNDQGNSKPYIDSTDTLRKRENVVRDSVYMMILEPNSGNQNWNNIYWPNEVIGVASGATVYEASFCPDWETLDGLAEYETYVAIKILNVNQTAHIQKLRQELQECARLPDHPNVIRIKKDFIAVDKDNHCVVMPLMAGGSLQSIISSRFPDGFPEECVRIALRETLKGLSHIHGMGCLHKYVDAKYIFLCPHSPAIKLAFGASLYERANNFPDDCTMALRSNSKPYCMRPAPEADDNYTIKADIWLVGITALQLAYGLEALNDGFFEKMVGVGKGFMPVDWEVKFSQAFRGMVAMCLDPDPSRRPETEELLGNEFFDQCRDVSYFSNLVAQTPLYKNWVYEE